MQAITTEVERDLLQEIIKNVKEERMTEAQARQAARDFLAILPLEDKQDLLEKLSEFSRTHVEAKGVFVKYAKPIEEEERLKKISMMSQHIQNGEIDHALTIAKGGTING